MNLKHALIPPAAWRTSSAVAGMAALVLAVGACSLPKQDVNTSPDAPSAGAAAAQATGRPAAATVGEAITVGGNKDETLTITVTKIVYGPHSTDGFSSPDSGNRYVAVQFRITNSGSASYNDAPLNDAKVLDASGQSFDPELGTDTSAGHSLSSLVNIAPGDSELGFITFQMPTEDKVAKVQFTTDSGFGSTAQWTTA